MMLIPTNTNLHNCLGTVITNDPRTLRSHVRVAEPYATLKDASLTCSKLGLGKFLLRPAILSNATNPDTGSSLAAKVILTICKLVAARDKPLIMWSCSQF